MTRNEEVAERLRLLHDPVIVIEDDWDGWECLVQALESLEGCLKGHTPPEPDWGFDLPSRVPIRGPVTHVEAMNVQLPPAWSGRTRFRWFIDDVPIDETSEPFADLDTSDIWPGDHTLAVEASLAQASGGHRLEPLAGHESDTRPVEEIEGIGPKIGERLARLGVETTTDLLEAGARPSGRAELAAGAGVNDAQVLAWVHAADLFRIVGVAGQYADLLDAAGVSSVPELARRNAVNLAAKLEEVKGGRVRRLPSVEEVGAWIDQAKKLQPAVFRDETSG